MLLQFISHHPYRHRKKRQKEEKLRHDVEIKRAHTQDLLKAN